VVSGRVGRRLVGDVGETLKWLWIKLPRIGELESRLGGGGGGGLNPIFEQMEVFTVEKAIW
jgi:hypothetical protein